MEINRKKLIYAILREINNNANIKYTAETFDVDDVLFNQVIHVIIEENYSNGFKF